MAKISVVSIDVDDNNIFNQTFKKKLCKGKIIFESDEGIDVFKIFKKENFIYFGLDYDDKSYITRYDIPSESFDAVFKQDNMIYNIISNNSKVIFCTEDGYLYLLDLSLNELLRTKTWKIPVGFESSDTVVFLSNSKVDFIYETKHLDELESLNEGFPFSLEITTPVFESNKIAFQTGYDVIVLDKLNNKKVFKKSTIVDSFIVSKRNRSKIIESIDGSMRYIIEPNIIVSSIKKLEDGIEFYGINTDEKVGLKYTLRNSFIQVSNDSDGFHMEIYSDDIISKCLRNGSEFKSYLEIKI